MTALYPSIDLRDGKVVRLIQGDYADQIDYDVDPVSVARSFCDGGTSWIHIVDLDAARSGERVNTPVVADVVSAVAGRASVQVGGGVRSLDDAAALADAGVTRVVMGSAAVADPSLVEVVATRIPVAVGLDHRAGLVAVHGWTEASDLTVDAALHRFSAASAFVITDISRDGMLAGPDVEGLASAVSATSTPVVASGGVGTLDDIAVLAAIDGLGGIITGRALYEGRFTVAEAIATIRKVTP